MMPAMPDDDQGCSPTIGYVTRSGRWRGAVSLSGLAMAAMVGLGACASAPTPHTTATKAPTTASPTASRARLPSLAAIPDGVPATVIRVVDGDTIHARVRGVDEDVRIIGMDSPESLKPDTPVECFAREASAAAKRLLQRGDPIVLQADPTQDTRDRYGRLLAHVFLADGRLFAETMIKHGWAVHYVYDDVPSIYADRLAAAEASAKAAQAGLWSPTTCNGNPHEAPKAP